MTPDSDTPKPDGQEEIQPDKPARILVCDPYNPALEVIETAADLILEGGIVAFPTDTVYGVGADATNAQAVARLYEVKGRPQTKAIAVLLHAVGQLKNIVRHVPPEVEPLLERYWPGPLTVVFERHPACLRAISSEPTIGVRIPDHYLALSLLSMVGRPLATTSANLSGQSDTVTAQQVAGQLGGRVDLVLDGGQAPGGVTSTVISVLEKPYRILRRGAIAKADIEKILGQSVEG